jgi:cytidylate kinase
MNKPKIIGLAGRAYAGKTTVADHLVKTYGFVAVANADALKTMLITAGLCTHDECYVKKTERSRELMQKVGTEIFRKQIHPDFWMQRTAKRIHELMAAGKSVVVHDIRFPNEAKLVGAYLGAGLVVKLERINTDGSPYRGAHAEANEHDSERLVDTINCDCTVTCETGVPVLIAAVETRLREYGFIGEQE